jgi:hypothetical protein
MAGKAAAAKSATRIAAAKRQVRSAKAQLKLARKLLKAEKKTAKQARKEAKAAQLTQAVRVVKEASIAKQQPPQKSGRAAKSKVQAAAPKRTATKRTTVKRSAAKQPATDAMRSAADVAKSVIERLQSPPPALPPEPIIPAVLPDPAKQP